MSNCSIFDWLNDIPDTEPSYKLPAPRTRKRHRPLTPESTNSGMSASDNCSPNKRQDIEDETPRPRRKRVQTVRSESDYSLGSPSRGSSISQKSGGSQSPSKQFNTLGRLDDGILIRQFSRLKNPSSGLKSLRDTMVDISRGKGILSPSVRQLFSEHPDEGVTTIASDDYCFSESRDRVGHTPPPQRVVDILDIGCEYNENFHAELGWNMMVHNDVLRLALWPPDQPLYQNMVNFMPCPTASIIHDYLPSLYPSKKVDFCIYIDPAYDDEDPRSEAQSAVLAVRDQLPEGVINHTAYYPLRERPIALRIETKKPGDDWDNATLQSCVWQVAHWNLLERLKGDEQTRPSQFPDFLPGIIIQGHEWYLVVATRENKKTVFWNNINIGSTGSIMGIYQIIHSIQVLREWVREFYWPAFRQLILPI